MSGIMVPRSTIEEFTSPRSAVFPEGLWRVTLDTAREKAFPAFIADNVAAGKNAGYSSGDGEILGLQFGSASNAETGETTNQKLFVDIVTRDGNVTIDGGETIPSSSWQMQNSAALLALMASATGAVEDVEGPDGQMYARIVDGFLDALRRGELPQVIVETYHRNWKTATSSGTEVRVRNFIQAV